jgi:hypothetical protein
MTSWSCTPERVTIRAGAPQEEARALLGGSEGATGVLMARSDTLLTGSLMAVIVMALVFDDDENGPAPSPSDDELVPEREEEGEADRARKPR